MAGSTGKKIELFALASPFYLEGSPVLIETGALLMDRFSEEETIRLSLKNIADSRLVSCEVRLRLFDEKNMPYADDLFFQFNGLNIERGQIFGNRKAIPLPDNHIRSFSATVTKVTFGDYTRWENEAEFTPIEAMESLSSALQSEELAKQYAVRYGKDCTYQPSAAADLWYCTCGAVNHESETKCYKCRRNRAAFDNINLRSLKRDSEARLKSEKLFEEAEQKKKEKKRKTGNLILRISLIVLPILLVAALILATVPPYMERKNSYSAAEKLLEEGKFSDASAAFSALGDYSDSKIRAEKDVPYAKAEYVLKCARTADPAALSLLGLSSADVDSRGLDMLLYEKAKDLFTELNGYKESEERLKEISAAFNDYDEAQRLLAYNSASSLLEQRSYLKARDAFLSMGGYKDAAQLAEECLYQRASGLLEFCETNNVRKIYLSVSRDPAVPSAVSMPGSALANLGSDTVGVLRSCFSGDGVEVFYEDQPGSTEQSAGYSFRPICEATAEEFEFLDTFKESKEGKERALAAGDFTAEFYALLRDGDLNEAAVWLNTYDDSVPEREYVSQWAELYAPWRRYWKLYGGDSTLIPFSGGIGEEERLGEFSSKVCIEGSRAVLCLEQPDGKYVVKLECEAGKTDFSYVENSNYFYARINNANHFVYMWYLENGNMLSSCEYYG